MSKAIQGMGRLEPEAGVGWRGRKREIWDDGVETVFYN